MASALLDLLFPPRCAGCGRGDWPFCVDCRAELVVLRPPWCARCGRPTDHPALECRDCPPPDVDVARAPFLFRGPARRAVHRLKFAGWRAVAEALAGAMAATVDEVGIDAVTWVPLARTRRARRGFDQARELADAVGRRLGLPVVELLARRSATGPSQARRGGADRRRAIRDAFVPTGPPAPARVLLVDDVLTTGTTAEACARALRTAGARRVVLLTATRAVSGRLPPHCYTRDLGSRPQAQLPSPPDAGSPTRGAPDGSS